MLLGAVGVAESARGAVLIGQVGGLLLLQDDLVGPKCALGGPEPVDRGGDGSGGHIGILAGLLNLLLVTGEQGCLGARRTRAVIHV